MNFKKGDRVKAIDYESGKIPNGVGIVIATNPHVTVLFPEWGEGHTNMIHQAPRRWVDARKNPAGGCWNYTRERAHKQLSKIERKTLKQLLGE